MKVLCFGSLNIDFTYKVHHFVGKGETLSSESMQVYGGGKGLNQSIALAKAGADVFHAGAIGDDGKFLLELLEHAGVDTRHVKVHDEIKTGNAIIQNDRDGDNCILLYGGANQSITVNQVDEVLNQFDQGDFIVLQNEINELAYIVTAAHQKGLKIVLNPSPMNEKILKIPLEYVDYFMLNEVEAKQILKMNPEDEYDGENLAKELQKRFPEAAIILTMGGDGSIYIDQNETIRQPVYRVQAVDTTAAGDTFTGFFIGGILSGMDVSKAMNLASKAASIAVTKAGASSSIPLLNEVGV